MPTAAHTTRVEQVLSHWANYIRMLVYARAPIARTRKLSDKALAARPHPETPPALLGPLHRELDDRQLRRPPQGVAIHTVSTVLL